jgi:hypothetical protein
MTLQREALVLMDSDRTLVAHLGAAAPDLAVLSIGDASGRYLQRIVHEVGDDYRLSILGPDDMRLALERAHLWSTHRPDRLHDIALR